MAYIFYIVSQLGNTFIICHKIVMTFCLCHSYVNSFVLYRAVMKHILYYDSNSIQLLEYVGVNGNRFFMYRARHTFYSVLQNGNNYYIDPL